MLTILMIFGGNICNKYSANIVVGGIIKLWKYGRTIFATKPYATSEDNVH